MSDSLSSNLPRDEEVPVELTAVSVVGSTGSIGTQSLEVIAANPDRFRVVALGARRSIDALADQARRFHPDVVAVEDETSARKLRETIPDDIDVLAGPDGLVAISQLGDTVLNGVAGFAGLPVTLAALESGKRLALANKESLIAGGPVVQRARKTTGAEIVPVDSEHCAIHQCLNTAPRGSDSSGVARLLVTASGGPFRGRSRSEMARVSVEDALAHPTWSMGKKITIDSSTLMNKGLEVIEAHELFGLPFDRIDVVVHPQSIVHSMVEFSDGATIAQLSHPDMRLPIGYAIGWPKRLKTPFGAIDWSKDIELTFERVDRELFSCLDLAYSAGREGRSAPAWLNAADEVAVAAFLDARIAWLQIADVVAETLDAWSGEDMTSVDDVLRADRDARRCAEAAIVRHEKAA